MAAQGCTHSHRELPDLHKSVRQKTSSCVHRDLCNWCYSDRVCYHVCYFITDSKFKQRANVKFYVKLGVVCQERRQRAVDDLPFMSGIITSDETWVYGYNPEIKQQSLQILHLEKLEELCLDQNQLTVLPNNISFLKHLTYLGINHNPISVLPEALGELRELRELWAINCGLISIPPCIGKLGKLQKLGLSSNSITALPPQFGNLKSLQWLNLADNKIEDVPEDLKNLQSLVFINLNKNRFKKIPKALIEMPSLQVLLMNFNSISSLEDDLVLGFSKLIKLDLRQNKLTLRPYHWKGLDFILLGSTETSMDDM